MSKIYSSFLAVLFLITLPQALLAQGAITISNPLTSTTFEEIVDNVINSLWNIAIVLAPAMIVYAAFLFMASGGNPQQLEKAKSVIFWTLAGFGIIMFSKAIISVIKDFFMIQ